MTTPSTVSSTRRWSIVVGAALVVLGIDQLTKAWAVDRLKDQLPIDVVWTLRFNYAENTGMAFSTGSGAGRWISLVVLAIVVALVLLARSVRSTAALVLIGVVIGGAFGNLFDRIFRAQAGFLSGAVVDWIDVQWWPIFNIAVAAVVVGGILIAIFLLREPVEDQPVPAAAEPATEPDAEPVSTDSGGSDAGSDAGVRPAPEDPTGTGEPGAR